MNIELTEELQKKLQAAIDVSKIHSKDGFQEYFKDDPRFSNYIEQYQQKHQAMVDKVKLERSLHPEYSDGEFFRKYIIDFLTPVVSKIEEQYGMDIPVERLSKLKGLLQERNITIISDPTSRHDYSADSKTGKIIINQAAIGKNHTGDISISIVNALGVIIHESFHQLIKMLIEDGIADERMFYLVDTQQGESVCHFPPGKYGQILSEGFVEKLATEFAEKNGFYYTIAPAYIPYVDICTSLMEKDPSIDHKFLFTHNVTDILNKMAPDARIAYEEAERLAMINADAERLKLDSNEHGYTKEQIPLTTITSDYVKKSWMEKAGHVISVRENSGYHKPLEVTQKVEKTSFTQRSDIEIQIAEQIREKNRVIAVEKQKEREKAKEDSKKLVKKVETKVNTQGGYISTVVLAVLLSFIAGAISVMIAYLIIHR